MKKIKWLAIIVAACALALCLVGCSGSSQDAQQQEAKDNGLSAAKKRTESLRTFKTILRQLRKAS